MVLFSAQDVIKDYAAHRALDRVSISVEEGQVHGLLGPNGAGKTTLIRIINQITAPDQGELFFEGRPMRASDIHQIGYLPEERGLYKKMKVGEQALYFAQLKGLSKRDALKSLKVWFEKFEIQAWWNKKVEELSKGMQQKVQFIITVVHKPKLLIFDEPFSGFDPINTNLLKQEILNLRKEGATIIFSTHNMASVEEICDHISLINKSKKIVDGPIHELKEHYKNHVFEIQYKGETYDFTRLLEADFRIIEHRQAERNNVLKVQHLNGKSNNELLQKLMQQIEIISFQEIIPSMNEVFIKVVEQANQK
ncbi:MAG: ABC transporter ATP-binding protein [Bacteroidetes bacterium GWF2_42_66]|nr:MAG: ABC transporter ATP-binding protein [Bacteroidetes bacterium GWA2_42_15]OFY01505.1 MAG: ABC transporter ATP-binding protein [Bacteroidetes bacterium GWE2_42_39]OFY43314.1 MAG: ABC transporter ATP-binding protein [Bacteroidetes bacterium GWF2_42_66]HBL77503.1 ABC transporter ATP-binding protein [Prolixibacteraceae bacterium]HCR89375.1 ABC transporter ATP-binding protein [Prolixibacteraceae bacterium]